MALRRKPATRNTPSPVRSEHGILQSELDEPARLAPSFARLADEIQVARDAYERGDLSKAAYAAQLQNLMITTADGATWTIGATSGRWQRRVAGGPWSIALPPGDDAIVFSSSAVALDELLSTTPAELLTPPGDIPTEPTRPVVPEGFPGVPAPVTDEATVTGPPLLHAGDGFGDVAGVGTWEAAAVREGYSTPDGQVVPEKRPASLDPDDVDDLGLPRELFFDD